MEVIQTARSQVSSPTQNSFLENCRQTQSIVSIYLISGVRLQGTIADYDASVILLKSDNYQLVFKRAIASLGPGKFPADINVPFKRANYP